MSKANNNINIKKKSKNPVFLIVCLIPIPIIVFLLLSFFYGNASLTLESMRITLQSSLFYVIIGAIVAGLLIYIITNIKFGEKKNVMIENDLEDTHFMTDREIKKDPAFVKTDISKLAEFDDGIPLRAINDKKKTEVVFLKKPIHVNVIGSTGTGKTTAFIDPIIQLFPRFKTKPCMIITDPKGELYRKHSRFLISQGYQVHVADYRKPYQSAKLNPFQPVIDRIREIQGLVETKNGKYFVANKQYASLEECEIVARKIEQVLRDEINLYLDDIAQTLFPGTDKDNQSWENGARDFILAVFHALTDDVLKNKIPEEKLCLHNVYYIISRNVSEDDISKMKEFFDLHKDNLICYSKAQTILASTDRTLSSFLSTLMQFVNSLSDSGIRCMTSGNDLSFTDFDTHPVAVFFIFPDEIVTRQRFVSLSLMQMYKMLVKLAENNEQNGVTNDMKLRRRCYFIMDEFGNLPKLHRFDDIATIARSREIFFICVLQSYSQLDTVYGKDPAIKILAQLQIKIFIGTDDSKTIQAFSELCGKRKIISKSVSVSVNKDANDSYSAKEQPLISPQKLQLLPSGMNGNAIVSCLGHYPIETRFTPSYKTKPGVYSIGNHEDEDGEMELFDSLRFETNIEEYLKTFKNTKESKPVESKKINPELEKPQPKEFERRNIEREMQSINNREMLEIYEQDAFINDLLKHEEKLEYLLKNKENTLKRVKAYIPLDVYNALEKAPNQKGKEILQNLLSTDNKIITLIRIELASLIEVFEKLAQTEKHYKLLNKRGV
jgi:type IV secretion system protein VirD4